MKEYVITGNGLAAYKIGEEQDPTKRAAMVSQLLKNHNFIYPADNGRGRGKFRHPAIIAAVSNIFLGPKGKGKLASSDGHKMKECVPKAAVAWCCVLVFLCELSDAD
jgi:hypothetical protein